MVRIILVDDQVSVRQGLRMRLDLEPGLQVVGEAGDGAQAVQLALALAPDVVIMDVEMPVLDGIAATRQLHAAAPHVGVVILSIHGDTSTQVRALAAGAAAFVPKQAPFEELLAAIFAAAPIGSRER